MDVDLLSYLAQSAHVCYRGYLARLLLLSMIGVIRVNAHRGYLGLVLPQENEFLQRRMTPLPSHL